MASLADEFLQDYESESGEDEDDDYLGGSANSSAPNSLYIESQPIGINPALATIKNLGATVEEEDDVPEKKTTKFIEPPPVRNMDDDDDDDDEEGISLLSKRVAAAARSNLAESKSTQKHNDLWLPSKDQEEDDDDQMKTTLSVHEKEAEAYNKLATKISADAKQYRSDVLDKVNPNLAKWKFQKSCLRNNSNKNDAIYLEKKKRQKLQFTLPKKQKTVFDIAGLKISSEYNDLMKKIQAAQLDQEQADDANYQLIIEANATISNIDYEFNKIYNYVRDIYTLRFPELETLIASRIEYIRAAGYIRNDLLSAKAALTGKLSDATVMIVAMTASNSQGRKLLGNQIDAIAEASNLAQDLQSDHETLVRFVQSRMSLLAPNVTAIIGPNVAAQLIGQAADGLHGLSRMPGCNVLLLGQEKSNQFSAQAKIPHTGYVFYSPLVQSVNPDIRRKAARQVANKIVIAARADAALTAAERHHEPALGIHFRDVVLAKFEKWDEPPKVKGTKALPKPLEHAGKKRRGGKRYRKMKERLGMTEIRKQQNRITFGEVEEDLNQEDLGISLGHLAANQAGGSIRNLVEEKKSKVRLSKKMRKVLEKEQVASGMKTSISSGFRTAHKELSGGKTTVLGWGGTVTSMLGAKRFHKSGLASSVTFTPIQGLEISNPENQHLDDPENGMRSNSNYFSSTFKAPKIPRMTN